MTAATKLTPKKREKFLTELRRTGNVTLSARVVGTTRFTVYGWRDRDAAFAAAWDEAVEEAADLLEAEARRRAHDGVEEPVFYQGDVVGHVKKYSDVLLMFLLKGIRPEKYRENLAVTGTIQVNVGLADRLKDARARRQAQFAAETHPR